MSDSTLAVGDRSIGGDHPAYVIAEAGINHNGSLQLAKKLVDIANEAGADAVKFQKRRLEETYREEVVTNPARSEMGVEYTVSNLKRVSLSDAEFRELADYTRESGIEFLCSPWDDSSVDFLENLDLPAYKIGSPDMTNFLLLERLVETGKPLLVSTGMAEEGEIERTVEFLEDRGAAFGLLHCRSTYPAPYHNLNLAFMEELDERYDVPVGYSGHERGIAVSGAAVAMGADVLERHFTVSRDMEGPDHAASLEAPGLEKLVRDVRNIEESQGTPKRYLTRGEYNNRVSLGKSLVAAREIPAGREITRADLTAKSPAKGVSPQELETVVGAEARRTIGADETIQWEDVDEGIAEEYDTALENWGIVVRFSDIADHDWGDPDVFEFRVNGSGLDEEFSVGDYEKGLGIHAPEQVGHDLVDPSARTEATRREAVDVLQRVIDKTREEIAPHFPTERPPIVVHPGGITTDHMDLESVPAMNEALDRSLAELDEEGVEVLMENMPPLPWIYGGQRYHNNFMAADEIAKFCERTGRRICYDTSHAKLWCNYADEDLIEHARTLRPYTAYLHVADAAGVDGEGLQIGEGEIDFERLLPLYDNFEGPIITEIWRGHEKRGAGFKQAAERLAELRNRV
ncbi:N-acetylneuraminate synthase family protein [Saliphagus sp. LR7]|uniref:N-acetylneuraminate synthase family protein n=1 Tax=Saliphagus sp. LR7 TaxID=2282654 RepID=UPI000DF77735|nr:N-acetylneuraminate synthase family protein [Saliphagus sp. LR7]